MEAENAVRLSSALLSVSCRIDQCPSPRPVRDCVVRRDLGDDLSGVISGKSNQMVLDVGFKAGPSSPRTAIFWLG